jgi:uncharacterized protein (DUF697 family)
MALERHYETIKTGVVAAGVAGPVGAIPGPLDALAIGGIWTIMLVSIAKKSGHQLSEAYVAKFVSIVSAGAVGYYGGCKVAGWLLNLIPGAGTLAAMGVSAVLNIIFTYKFGVTVADIFDRDEFNLNDAATAASAVLLLLCAVPTLHDIREIIRLIQTTA